MKVWTRGVFAPGFAAGLMYLSYAIRLHVDFTRFLLKSEDMGAESFLIILLSWIWSSVPIALIWCAFTFLGATWGMRIPVLRLAAIGVGLVAVAGLLAVIIGLLWPSTRI